MGCHAFGGSGATTALPQPAFGLGENLDASGLQQARVDRQVPDALGGGGEDGVGQHRSATEIIRLAEAALQQALPHPRDLPPI